MANKVRVFELWPGVDYIFTGENLSQRKIQLETSAAGTLLGISFRLPEPVIERKGFDARKAREFLEASNEFVFMPAENKVVKNKKTKTRGISKGVLPGGIFKTKRSMTDRLRKLKMGKVGDQVQVPKSERKRVYQAAKNLKIKVKTRTDVLTNRLIATRVE